ncbi:MAG: hydantoinase/oxoprolinase family protein [Thermodesulfobacteriota bacterium]|jgi:N-methylhydantoinase A
MQYFCGVDTGGTFTDCVVMDERGQITIAKSPSTPKDFAEGFFNALAAAAEKLGLTLGQLMQQTRLLLHGTTVGTNAVVQLRGAKTGLITTRGHGDALIIMRSVGRSAGLPIEKLLHVSRHQKPAPIIPRTLIREVSERVDWRGEVFLPLNTDEARAAIQYLLDQQVEAIAIAFLWGFVNPAHELAVKRMVQEMSPSTFVTCAHELIAKPGEYERTAATAINCFIGPGSSGYIRRVQERATQLGYRQPLLIMQASGGVATASEAAQKPVFTIGSGPAGGIIGAKFLADLLGHRNVIASDVGGTSFDVGIISDGRPLTASETVIHQYTFFMPQLDIQSIGSGGGSVIWVDELSGTMKVGPHSAGADPGPACYNRGGEEPTITDANLLLGYLNPHNFLGGKFTLDTNSSVRAMRRVADRLGMDVVEAASGAVQIVEFHMADLMRQMTVQRGLDPRDFIVYAYGGGGPLHVVSYARELGCRTVVVPLGSVASTWSALGIQSADLLHVYEKAELLIAPFDHQRLNDIFAELEAKGRAQLREDGIAEDAMRVYRSADMKFRLQIHRVEVPVPGGLLTAQETERLMQTFADKYESLYGKGSAFKEAGMEIGVLRVVAAGVIPRPTLSRQARRTGEALTSRRDVYWREARRFVATPVYDGTKLAAEVRVAGPAVIELPETTIVLRPESAGQLDEYGNFVISIA